MWTTLGILFLLLPALLVCGLVLYVYILVRWQYLEQLERIFVEKPLFVIPFGSNDPSAEAVRLPTVNGQFLQACYFKTTATQRKGVLLFGIEFGSDRWSCLPYCEALLAAGYDVFAYEPRNQGLSDKIPEYEPLQWLTDHEIADAQAALAYLKNRPDHDPKRLGFFGISKGANTGLALMSREPIIRCGVTDGAFGMVSVMVPYMRHWVRIYNSNFLVHGILPYWFYASIAKAGIRRVQRKRKVRFYQLEAALRRIRQPLLMIHGAADSYIKEAMARELFRRAAGQKEFWSVPTARHNQALTVATAEYTRRVVDFFDRHLASE